MQNKQLPKKDKEDKYYLSYSQYTKFKDSIRKYIRRYMLGEEEPTNAHFTFGSLIGGALETGDFSEFTKEEQELLKQIPRFDEFERKIKLDMGWFYVVGYIDTNTLVNKDGSKEKVVTKIKDYKTGAEDKKEVYESKDYVQLNIYGEAIRQEQGFLPEASVTLIEKLGNSFNNEDLVLGTRTWEIEKKLNEEEIAETLDSLNSAADSISEYTRLFNDLKTIKV